MGLEDDEVAGRAIEVRSDRWPHEASARVQGPHDRSAIEVTRHPRDVGELDVLVVETARLNRAKLHLDITLSAY